MVSEQRLVRIALVGLDAEQHQPGGFAVNAVNWNQGVNAEPLFEPHQQCFLQVVAGWCDGQEVRFVGHDQMVVLVQHGFFKRDARLCIDIAVVINTHVAGVRPFRGDQPPVFVHHQLVGHALKPDLAGNGGEAFNQKISDGGPIS